MSSVEFEEHCEEGARVLNLRGVMTDEEIELLRQRNEERRRQAIEELGERWLLARTRLAA